MASRGMWVFSALAESGYSSGPTLLWFVPSTTHLQRQYCDVIGRSHLLVALGFSFSTCSPRHAVVGLASILP